MKIPNSLIAAYLGQMDLADTPENTRTVVMKITAATTEERLATYLEWEGIIGYTGIIMTIVEMEAPNHE